MTRQFLFFLGVFFTFCSNSFSQDLSRFKSTIDTLCSPSMGGRGYVNAGDKFAAFYLSKRFEQLGLKKFEDNYLQQFPISVNTFPGKVQLTVNGKKLVVGQDFIVDPSSGGCKGSGNAFYLKKKHLENPASFVKNKKRKGSTLIFKGKEYAQLVSKHLGDRPLNAKNMAGVVYETAIKVTDKKLTAWMSQKSTSSTTFIVKEEALPKKIKKVSYTVESVFEKDYISQNVIGYIPGKTQPDSFVVLGAHYDHLGKMGPTAYFPGANDNASGVTMMLELAEYFSIPGNEPEKSIVFIAFGGEEVGLIGSKYFCANPLFDLKKASFMVSLDLFGAGSKGITAVNGSEFKKEFKLLQQANKAGNYLPQIKPRKPTANSDHYFFYKNGVRCFFLYTMGSLTAYHDVQDQSKILEYDQFEKVFEVLKGFVTQLSL